MMTKTSVYHVSLHCWYYNDHDHDHDDIDGDDDDDDGSGGCGGVGVVYAAKNMLISVIRVSCRQ